MHVGGWRQKRGPHGAGYGGDQPGYGRNQRVLRKAEKEEEVEGEEKEGQNRQSRALVASYRVTIDRGARKGPLPLLSRSLFSRLSRMNNSSPGGSESDGGGSQPNFVARSAAKNQERRTRW